MTFPQTQSFLPVVLSNGRIPGLIAIPSTEFVGNETTFNLTVGSVTIEKKTLPTTTLRQRLPEYMAAVFNHAESRNGAYAQFLEWIPLEKINSDFRWYQNNMTNYLSVFEGLMLTCLRKGFTAKIGQTISSPPIVGNPAATMDLQVNAEIAGQEGAQFFDINWVSIFEAQFPTKTPASIVVTAQPAEDDLKAYIMTGGQPVVGQIKSNTIRIIKVKKGSLTAGTRLFEFRINDMAQASAMLPPSLEQFATGGTLGAATYEYRVSAIVDGIESIASSPVSVIVAAGTTNRVVVTWGLVPNATGYHVYGRTTMKRLQSFGAGISSYDDTGADAPGTEDPILTNFTDVTLTVTIS